MMAKKGHARSRACMNRRAWRGSGFYRLGRAGLAMTTDIVKFAIASEYKQAGWATIDHRSCACAQ